MTEKEYKTVCRMITYDKMHEFREKEHKSIQWIADRVGFNFRKARRYLEMDRAAFERYSERIASRPSQLDS